MVVVAGGGGGDDAVEMRVNGGVDGVDESLAMVRPTKILSRRSPPSGIHRLPRLESTRSLPNVNDLDKRHGRVETYFSFALP